MSATPEQIAIDEKALEAAKNAAPFAWTGFHDEHFRAVLAAYLSATKDAQAERERVLEEALQYVMSAHGEQLTDAFEQAHKALAKATGAPQ